MSTGWRRAGAWLGIIFWLATGCDSAVDATTPELVQVPCDELGGCPAGYACTGGRCVSLPDGGADAASPADARGGDACVPSCTGRECGPNGCGGLCGACGPGLTCTAAGLCGSEPCEPDCTGRECGPDGCQGSCGGCPAGHACSAAGLCEPEACEPDCAGRECGPDGCGGVCGACPADFHCTDTGLCEGGPCLPDCTDRECGPDGCDGVCGICEPGESCTTAGQCSLEPCEPDCADRECGPDGCDGVCGACAAGEFCLAGRCQAAECGVTPPSYEGQLDTEAAPVTFDTVAVAVGHKRDIDPWEDGCITSIVIDFALGEGCALHIEAGAAYDRDNGLRITALAFSADSQCPGFADEAEGLYTDVTGLSQATVTPDVVRVPDRNAAESCLLTTFTVRLAGVLSDPLLGRSLFIEPSTLRVGGAFLSVGSTSASCPCVPDCAERECGADGCGGQCGSCGSGSLCDAEAGTCRCVPDCDGRECGDDGCEGQCGSCWFGTRCAEGRCVPCQPDCAGRECGDDGCDGQCGSCGPNERCTDGQCICVPSCVDRQCGDDGCGGSCGSCPAGLFCVHGRCGACEPDCTDRVCGDDGCGGSCAPGCINAGDVCLGGSCQSCAVGCTGADLLIAVQWSPESDIDLHVVDPSGEEIFYGHRQCTSGGTLVRESNAACQFDFVNTEIAYWPADAAPAGTYHVFVDLWDDCNLGAASYTVTVRSCGLDTHYTGTLQPEQANGGAACCQATQPPTPIGGPADCMPGDCTYVVAFDHQPCTALP